MELQKTEQEFSKLMKSITSQTLGDQYEIYRKALDSNKNSSTIELPFLLSQFNSQLKDMYAGLSNEERKILEKEQKQNPKRKGTPELIGIVNLNKLIENLKHDKQEEIYSSVFNTLKENKNDNLFQILKRQVAISLLSDKFKFSFDNRVLKNEENKDFIKKLSLGSSKTTKLISSKAISDANIIPVIIGNINHILTAIEDLDFRTKTIIKRKINDDKFNNLPISQVYNALKEVAIDSITDNEKIASFREKLQEGSINTTRLTHSNTIIGLKIWNINHLLTVASELDNETKSIISEKLGSDRTLIKTPINQVYNIYKGIIQESILENSLKDCVKFGSDFTKSFLEKFDATEFLKKDTEINADLLNKISTSHNTSNPEVENALNGLYEATQGLTNHPIKPNGIKRKNKI